MLQPFHLRGPITDPADFFGRDYELEQIFSLISKEAYVSLVGESLSGKTSLLYQLQHPEVQANYWRGAQELFFVFIDCQDWHLDTPESFYRTILEEIREQLPEIPVTSIETRSDLTLREYLKRLNELNKKPVLLLDEFEVLHFHRSFEPGFYMNLRARWRDGVRIITATRMPLKECCPRQVGSDFFNLFNGIYVGSFTRGEFEQFITRICNRYQFPCDDCALSEFKKEILDLGGRFPFFVQQAGHLFCEAGQQGQHRHRTKEQLYGDIKGEFAFSLQSVFELILDNVSPDEQKTLRALARGELRAGQSDTALVSLEKKGYILDHGRIFSSAFKEFILLDDADLKKPSRQFKVDGENEIVMADGEIKDLAPLEHKLFFHLYRNIGRTCTFNELWEKVWGFDPPADRPVINTAIKRLRNKIQDYNKDYVQTVWGFGYRFLWPDHDRPDVRSQRQSSYRPVR